MITAADVAPSRWETQMERRDTDVFVNCNKKQEDETNTLNRLKFWCRTEAGDTHYY